MAETYDYIVVGAGSAGCVVASRLSKEFGKKVLLLEAGGSDASPLISMPAGSFHMIFNGSPAVKVHESAPQRGLGGRRVPLLQGHVLGGSSSINVMMYVRGSREDFDAWNKVTGTNLWGWDAILPHYVKQERNHSFSNEYHGTTGSLQVSDQPHVTEGDPIFVETARRLGIPLSIDFTTGKMAGVGYNQATLGRGRRCNAAKAFLRSGRGKGQPQLRLDATVTRVLMEKKRAVGVEYLWRGKTISATATAGVILTAGALVTPKLLMLSGVGPAEQLRRHGIAVHADLPGVGRNLQDHQMVYLPAATRKNYGLYGADKGGQLIANILRYALFRNGPIAATGSQTVCFCNLVSPGSTSDTQAYCLQVVLPGMEVDHQQPGVTLMASLLRPRASGVVELGSANPLDDPVFDLNWMTDPDDTAALVRMFRFLQKLAGSEPLAGILDTTDNPALGLDTDEEILRYVAATTASNYHLCGTARMGRPGDPLAVLDPTLKVQGVDGLWVMDASAMPNVISANTNATVMAVADRGVDLMMGRVVPASEATV